MASVTLCRLTPPTSQKGFNCFYPSDNRLRLNTFNKLTWFSLILTLLLQNPIELTSLRHQLHIAPRFLICFPKRKIELGQKAIKNAFFCQYLSDILFHCIVCVISLLLLISGDVQPYHGPKVSLDTSTSSSCSDIPGMSVLRDHLNIVHLNIQSLYSKRDILEVEMQYYDIVVLTETWLSPNKKTTGDIMIPNFDAPYRKDRNDRPGGGVAIYTKSGISSHKLTNLIYGDLEGPCVKINIRNHTFLLCGIYRPPNAGIELWDSIERTFKNLNNSTTKNIIILGGSTIFPMVE